MFGFNIKCRCRPQSLACPGECSLVWSSCQCSMEVTWGWMDGTLLPEALTEPVWFRILFILQSYISFFIQKKLAKKYIIISPQITIINIFTIQFTCFYWTMQSLMNKSKLFQVQRKHILVKWGTNPYWYILHDEFFLPICSGSPENIALVCTVCLFVCCA